MSFVTTKVGSEALNNLREAIIEEHGKLRGHLQETVTEAVEEKVERLRLKETFKKKYGVDELVDKAVSEHCPLHIVGEECPGHGSSDCPFHGRRSRTFDHPHLWLKDGDPALFCCHNYDVSSYNDTIRELLDWAEKWGFALTVDSLSYYNPGSTVAFVFMEA